MAQSLKELDYVLCILEHGPARAGAGKVRKNVRK
jgi:hypothetical protein